MEMNTVQVVLVAVVVVLIHVFNVLLLRSRSLRAKLHRQGIHGPSPHFYFGNIPEMKTLLLQVQSAPITQVKDKDDHDSLSHKWPFTLFPHIQKWISQYDSIAMYFTASVPNFGIVSLVQKALLATGLKESSPIYLFSSGTIQWLMVSDIEMVKEIIMYTSLNLGKPSYLSKDMGPLLGQGILTSSGPIWAHQRKIIAPELYLDKAMVNLIVDSTNVTLRSWEARLESEGAVSEIKIDDDLRSLSADIIARTCFGSNYIEGKEIFSKLRDLQKLLSKIHVGIPGFRYLPNKSNRQMWRLEKEINSKISKLIKQRQEETHEQDLLQMILEGAKNCEGSDGLLSDSISCDVFMIDNCKNIFFAGHETTAITASWCLMLLAAHQDWQDRARAEVLEVCGKGAPDASSKRHFIILFHSTPQIQRLHLTMVIQETLRLYSPAAFVVRTALQDVNLKGILIPKGMNIQIPISVLQQDPQLWGPDAHKFNPERFSNGVFGACKVSQAYMPFGIGARVCVGQHLAMTELKVILSLILLKFHFSLSLSYCHSPAFRLVIEPGQGVVLKMTRI
ncbi:Cytochrome P450 714C2 isoform F [Glycine soja]|uniref:Cytochrome P450 714C2 isoform F n=1 Tax=Glycine soja TaxID=3848 RepID=A0A445JVM3_GLYSO|nr:Cytochrome P450 714C2 isoform F [Glycine soja]